MMWAVGYGLCCFGLFVLFCCLDGCVGIDLGVLIVLV